MHYLQNYLDLFSQDDAKVYRAIQVKKDWLFRPLYMKVYFTKEIEEGKELYKDLYAVYDDSIRFEKLEQTNNLSIAFNESFSYKKLYEDIECEEHSFLIKLDFNKMDNKAYKELVANFYPCLTKEELEIDESDEVINLLKLPMIGKKREWVLILQDTLLLNQNYFLPIFNEIIYDEKLLTKEEIQFIIDLVKEKELAVTNINE